MQTTPATIVYPKFVSASSRIGLENACRRLIYKNRKVYDFYFFFKDGDEYIAVYREQMEIKDEIANDLKGKQT